MSIRLTIDLEQQPKGGSSSIVKYRDEDGSSCSYGNGNGYGEGHIRVVHVFFRKFELDVNGGRSFYDYIETHKDQEGWFNAALTYTIRHLSEQGVLNQTLLEMLCIVKQRGFKEGVEHAQQQVRQVLGIQERSDCYDYEC